MQYDLNEAPFDTDWVVVGDRSLSQCLSIAYPGGGETIAEVGDAAYKAIISETAKSFDFRCALSDTFTCADVGTPISMGSLSITSLDIHQLPKRMLDPSGNALTRLNIKGKALDDLMVLSGYWCVIPERLRETLRLLLLPDPKDEDPKTINLRPNKAQFISAPAVVNGFSLREVVFLKTLELI